MTLTEYQNGVRAWTLLCFGKDVANNESLRNFRFLEEALELVQSLGCTKEEALKLVDYVYARPIGSPSQEVGGVMVTLAALCAASGINIDLEDAARYELIRCYQKITEIREKQARKLHRDPTGPLP